MKLEVFFIVLAVALVTAISLALLIPPKVVISGQGTLAIDITQNLDPAQLDIVDIDNIPAYGVIEPSGCGEHKGRVKIRFDMFMEPSAPYYDVCYVEVIDTTSPEFLAGYSGKVDEKTGEPLDWEDYQKWEDSLPTVWQNNSFHSHFVYFDTTVTDEEIKLKLADVTEYFYAFHLHCWDSNKTFLEEWVKVPKEAGTIRDVFAEGVEAKVDCEVKADDVVARLVDFDTRYFDESRAPPQDLNIGDKGTITMGGAPTDRAGYMWDDYVAITLDNPASANGSIDTVNIHTPNSMYNTTFGIFFLVSGVTYECRDNEAIGTVTAGAPDPDVFTGLDMTVVSGDFIGDHCTLGNGPDKDTSGGAGVYYKSDSVGTYIQPTAQADYTLMADDIMSLQGTGTEAGGDPDISNTPATWAIGTVATSTDYWSSGSEPSWPLDDGECAFTVTNNGDTCSITVKGTNFTGGVGWTLAASPAENTVTMKAGKSGDANEGAFITLTTSEQSFISGLAGSGTKKWELMMESATSHTDGVLKEGIVTLTATLD